MKLYHNWLLKRRVYCEIGSCMVPATRVAHVGFEDKCVCDACYAAHTPLETGMRGRQVLDQARKLGWREVNT